MTILLPKSKSCWTVWNDFSQPYVSFLYQIAKRSHFRNAFLYPLTLFEPCSVNFQQVNFCAIINGRKHFDKAKSFSIRHRYNAVTIGCSQCKNVHSLHIFYFVKGVQYSTDGKYFEKCFFQSGTGIMSLQSVVRQCGRQIICTIFTLSKSVSCRVKISRWGQNTTGYFQNPIDKRCDKK